MPSRVIGERLAILAIDPGETSGVAAAYVPKLETLKESLLAADYKKAVEVRGINPNDDVPTFEEDWIIHGRRLTNIMRHFEFTALIENEIPMNNIHIVVEDFILRRKRQGGATGNLTSCWVAAAAVSNFKNGNVSSPEIHWQQASLAKGKATNDRLKLWGLYEPGSEHLKDAWRHLATLCDRLL
jgi:hypothetical protein